MRSSTVELPPPRVLQLPAQRPKRPRLPLVGRMPEGMGAVVNDQAPNPYPAGECTWGVWQLVWDTWGVAMPDFPGNATDWGQGLTKWGAQQMPGPTTNAIVVWSSSKYPPFGHVALITDVRDSSFTVKEMNFSAWNTWDTRVVRPGPDQDGIEGYWVPRGVEPGPTSGSAQAFASTDPWSELTGGIAQVERQAEAQVSALGRKIAAGGEILLGVAGIGLGTTLAVVAIRNPDRARQQLVSLPRRLAGRARSQALPAAREAVLGAAPAAARRVTAAARARMLPR